MKKILKGDYVLIKSLHNINQHLFDKTWPQGLFGKVFDVVQRYSQFDGKKLPLRVSVRCYKKGGKYHVTTNPKSLTPIYK